MKLILLLNLAVLALAFVAAPATALADEAGPWPADVKGFKAPAAGEHPRLLFRKSDLPALRQRAQTPEGKALIQRLKITLDGADGTDLPKQFGMDTRPAQDGSGPLAKSPDGSVYTISHVAGYGFLYQLTGEKRYADLGREAMEKALDGYRGRDQRYSFKQPFGALRAGPALGWHAVGYDLCYDGWDPAFRQKVAQAIANYNEGANCSLEELVRGSRHFPASNHWGMQVGGGALAVLAIMNDPGVDMKKIAPLLETSQKAMIRNVTEGFGDGGYFAEGDGTGSMASHIVYLSAIQAWKVAGGKDFVSPRMNVPWTALKWFLLTVPQKGKLDNLRSCFPERGGYPHNIWARDDGVSGAGYFSIGYQAVTDKQRPALWWCYNQWLKDHDDKNRTPYDSPSPYPHNTILAFVNTPFDLTPANPIECMPWYVHDTKHAFFAFRNRWQDENDTVISQLTKKSPHRFAHGPDKAMVIQSQGKKMTWGSIPSDAKILAAGDDRTAIVGNGKTSLAIDFSGVSGADAVLIMTGPGAPGGDVIEAGGTKFSVLVLGGSVKPQAQGDTLVIGKRTVSFANGRIVLK